MKVDQRSTVYRALQREDKMRLDDAYEREVTSMIELKCKNCNSTDFAYKGGLWVCNSCGSKYIPEKDEMPAAIEHAAIPSGSAYGKTRKGELIEELRDAFRKFHWINESDEDEEYRRDCLIRIVEESTKSLMKINPDSPYVGVGKMFSLGYRGIKSQSDAKQFVEAMEIAIEHSDLEAKIRLWDELGFLMNRFGSRVYTKARDEEERIYHLVDVLGEYNPKYRFYPKLEEFYVARDSHVPDEGDHSVAVLKSFDISRYPVKHWYETSDGGCNGCWRLLLIPLAGVLIIVGLFTVWFSFPFGVGMIVLAVMTIKHVLSQIRK